MCDLEVVWKTLFNFYYCENISKKLIRLFRWYKNECMAENYLSHNIQHYTLSGET